MAARAPRRSLTATKPYRRAAICGLSNYRKLPLLRHVQYDLVNMRNSLIRTGFDLDDSLMIRREQKGGEGFFDWLAAAFGGAPEGSVLLLHLCGHGTRLDQQWIFCFENFDPQDTASQTYYCMRQEQFESFARNTLVKARVVIVGVDTCNDDLKSATFQLMTMIANPPERRPPGDGTLVLVFGAEAGETVSSIRGHGGHFTRAWAEAIDPSSWPRTLEDAIAFAETRVKSLCKQHSSPSQRVNAIPSRHDPKSMSLGIFDHHKMKKKGASSGTAAAATTASPADADFPYVDLVMDDGTLVRLIQSMEPAISGQAEGNEIELMQLLSDRIEQLRRALRPDTARPN